MSPAAGRAGGLGALVAPGRAVRERGAAGVTTRYTHWSPAIAVPDAVEEAKAAARAEGHAVRTVARVSRTCASCAYPRPQGERARLGWLVELVLR